MDTILEQKEWSVKKILSFYKNNNFLERFSSFLCEDEYLRKFIYANVFFERVRFEKKLVCERISKQELMKYIEPILTDFLNHAVMVKDPDELFDYAVYEGIFTEQEAVIHLRSELVYLINDQSVYYFSESCVDENTLDMDKFFLYKENKHNGKKYSVYLDCIMSNIHALGFLGGSFYIQELMNPKDEIDFDIFYENMKDFLINVMEISNIDREAKTTKTTFKRDLKKIYKTVHELNREESLFD